MKNLFKQNPTLLPWLNGMAKYYNDIGNTVARTFKGQEYYVGLKPYIDAVQMLTDPDFAKKLANLNLRDYKMYASKTHDNRDIWYEMGVFTSALDTLFRFVDVVAHNSEVLTNKGCVITNNDKSLAGQLYKFYTSIFDQFRENCFNNLNHEDLGKYLTFIDQQEIVNGFKASIQKAFYIGFAINKSIY